VLDRPVPIRVDSDPPLPPAGALTRAGRAALSVVRRWRGSGRPAPVELRLRDGTPARLRPLLPLDRDDLVRGLERMSAHSRYLRFHAPVVTLDEARLRYLTELDHHDHFAWGLLVPERGRWTGVAVARFVRLADRPSDAEVAMTVLDEYQGRGAGGVLLEALALAAAVHDVQRLRCSVLPENQAMRALVAAAGGWTRRERDGMVGGTILAAAVAGRAASSVRRRLGELARLAPALSVAHGVGG
jgi:RimJ/RimL family protein N-acetyltransferase